MGPRRWLDGNRESPRDEWSTPVPGLARSPPVAGLALAAALGASLFHGGISFLWLLIPAVALPLLNRTSRSPGAGWTGIGLALLAGYLLSSAWGRGAGEDCRFRLEEGTLEVAGRLVGPLTRGRAEIAPWRVAPGDCRRPLRLVVPGLDSPGDTDVVWGAGSGVRVVGRWRRSGFPSGAHGIRAGYLLVDSVQANPTPSGPSVRDALVSLGGWVQNRLELLFPRTASVASALVWARKEGLDPDLKEAFARAGTAHLLAISGFHVGVVAGVLLLLLARTGAPHPLRFVLGSLGVWFYVVAIGLPAAATRAALLFSLVAVGRWFHRPVAPLGALSTAFLGFLVLSPGSLLSPGFQLSFAGATGLAVGLRPLSRWVQERTGGRLPMALCRGLGAGVAATLATLPLVGWHFGRVSMVGIPVTLLATPVIALVIPGIFLVLALSAVNLPGARFLASGVELALQLLLEMVRAAASLPMASVWVSRPVVLAGLAALLTVLALPRVFPGGGSSVRKRRALLVAAGLLVLGPSAFRLASLGLVEIVVLDVGQGDATLLRSPGGHWVLVDAGPRTRTFDAGEQVVLPYLRRRGIHELELLILTHPDMDHVGGAEAILGGVSVGAVLDPGEAAGSEVFLNALEKAGERGVPWRIVRAGDSLNLDGLALRIVAPARDLPGDPEEGNNAASLVLELRHGDFAALLTGDAPSSSEAAFLQGILSPGVQILKVGHHGSATSTSHGLLARVRPEVALISAGRRNRFGHPAPGVLARLREESVRVLRTDRSGDLMVRARGDGSYRIVVEFP